MTKKSQYYMFGAIVFISAIFVIYTSKSGIVVKKIGAIESYKDNYEYEGLNVLNNAIYEKSNLSEAMRNYTESFISYAGSNNVDVGMVFMFSRGDKIYVNNFVTDQVIVQETFDLDYLEEQEIDYDDTVTIRFRDETYSYMFTMPMKTELKVLLVETN